MCVQACNTGVNTTACMVCLDLILARRRGMSAISCATRSCTEVGMITLVVPREMKDSGLINSSMLSILAARCLYMRRCKLRCIGKGAKHLVQVCQRVRLLVIPTLRCGDFATRMEEQWSARVMPIHAAQYPPMVSRGYAKMSRTQPEAVQKAIFRANVSEHGTTRISSTSPPSSSRSCL
jgi:hypothetical protein